MSRELRRIKAVADEGTVYEIIEYELPGPSFTPITTGETQHLKGGTELRLHDGRDVTYRDDGTFQIVETGEILRPI
jgi:hypothetical protein